MLRTIGSSLRNLAREVGGISCRAEDDTFLLYCPHQDDYDHLINKFLSVVFAENEIAEKVSMRFGIYPNAKQESDIEERFERARIAANNIKKDTDNKTYGFYDM